MAAIIGDLSITLGDGTTLTATTDVGLARAWAEHEHGTELWRALRLGEQAREIAAALEALRSAHAVG